MSKFKVGDKVFLDNLEDPDGGFFCEGSSNPFGVLGEVKDLWSPYLPISVKWANGFTNFYHEINLSPLNLEENT